MQHSNRDLSWALGPEESRRTLGLLYVGFGAMFGFILYFAVEALRLGLPPISLIVLLHGAGFVGFFLLFYALIGRLERLEKYIYPSGRWFLLSFSRVSQFHWFLVVSVIEFVGLSAFGLWLGRDVYILGENVVVLLFAILALGGFGGAILLSSRGKFDVDNLTLEYNTPLSTIEWITVDLETLAGVKRLNVGKRTYLWLSFEKETDHPFFRGPYMIPTETIEQMWPRIEAGIATSHESAEMDTNEPTYM